MIRKLLVVIILIAGSVYSQGDFHAFQTGDRAIEARVLSVDSKRGTVELELRNKQCKTVQISIFSANDQTFISDSGKVMAFESRQFKIELEKTVLEKRRELLGPQKAIQRDTESFCYDIKISNKTRFTFNGVTVEYNIFYEQEELGIGKNDIKKFYVDGAIKVEPLAPQGTATVQTGRFEIYSQRLVGGYDGYSKGTPTNQSGKSKGVWLKIYLKTSSGLTAMREVCLPKDTNKLFTWQTSKE